MATTTIVTAFISNANSARSIDEYVMLGTKLLLMPVPTVCFIEAHVYYNFFHHRSSFFPQTIFCLFEKSDNYMYKRIEELTAFAPATDNSKKDTLGYMFVQCHKTEWVRMAMDMDLFHTEQYMWVDFGIYHIMDSHVDFASSLLSATKNQYEGVRIASIKDLSTTVDDTVLLSSVQWFFAGGVFGGDKGSLYSFAALMASTVNKLMAHKHTITWEVNIWYMIYRDHTTLFLPYTADHDSTILDKY